MFGNDIIHWHSKTLNPLERLGRLFALPAKRVDPVQARQRALAGRLGETVWTLDGWTQPGPATRKYPAGSRRPTPSRAWLVRQQSVGGKLKALNADGRAAWLRAVVCPLDPSAVLGDSPSRHAPHRSSMTVNQSYGGAHGCAQRLQVHRSGPGTPGPVHCFKLVGGRGSGSGCSESSTVRAGTARPSRE